MQSVQKVTTTTSMMRGEAYRTYANFDTEEVAKKYEIISKEITDLQLALDRVNLTETFEIDIEE